MPAKIAELRADFAYSSRKSIPGRAASSRAGGCARRSRADGGVSAEGGRAMGRLKAKGALTGVRACSACGDLSGPIGLCLCKDHYSGGVQKHLVQTQPKKGSLV